MDQTIKASSPAGATQPGLECGHAGHPLPELSARYLDRLEYMRALRALRISLGITGVGDLDWAEPPSPPTEP